MPGVDWHTFAGVGAKTISFQTVITRGIVQVLARSIRKKDFFGEETGVMRYIVAAAELQCNGRCHVIRWQEVNQ
jgi:hypothetical protein